jgi:AcrR family transcriptional regulator
VSAFRESAAAGRREGVRNLIMDAAIELCLEKGYDEVSVEDVANSVGMSTRTFYRYFSSKREIMVAFSLRSAAYLPRAILARPDGETPVEGVFRAASEWDDSVDRTYWALIEIPRRRPVPGDEWEGAIHVSFRAMVAEAIETRWPGQTNAMLLAGVIVGVKDAVGDQTIATREDRRPRMRSALEELRAAFAETPTPL